MAENMIKSPMELNGLSKYLSLVFHRSFERAVWTFCELGIADLMANHKHPITALELSQLNGNNWNAEFLYRLLRVIADGNIVTQVNTDDEHSKNKPEETIRYQLTEDGLLLTNDHHSKTRDMIRLELDPNLEKTYAYLPSMIQFDCQNGNSFEQAFGCNIFEYMQKEENKEYATLFNNSLITYSHYMTSSVTSTVDFSRFNTIVDIAGGLGTLLSNVLEKYKDLHGILFDLEHVIEHAKTIDPNEFQRKQIESDRYEFAIGDLFKSETIPQADAYLLKFIIHDWNDEKSIEILKSIRQANQTQVGKIITVFILETIIQSNDKDNWEIHVMDVQMLAAAGSKERTLNEYINLLNQSGYQLKQVYQTKNLMSIIEAITTIEN